LKKIITVLTDFGTRDAYAGIMKGVISSINPAATVVDITHDVDPQDVKEGAFLIPAYYPYFPEGTIHVAVVDPTVGSSRRPLVIERDGHVFVGPDNGIFTLLLDGPYNARTIENSRYMLSHISSTFHGRDIFAPAAAHLSLEVGIAEFGGIRDNPVRLTGIMPEIQAGTLSGEIIRFDRFGNGITNISRDVFEGFVGGHSFRITVDGISFDMLGESYHQGEFSCLFGSAGYLEFACYRGSFQEEKKLWKGDEVTVKIR
jgi:S-adenosylmethionine hydrolase